MTTDTSIPDNPDESPPVRLLFVEDDADDFMIGKALLAQSGERRFEIDWARDLRSAIDALENAPDVVLLDLTLPDSSGWATFAAMSEAAPHTPIVLLTGVADAEMATRAVQRGAQDYLVKGRIDARVFGHAIQYAIERKKTEETLTRVAAELRERNDQLADDLRMAREVQHALLPRRYPAFPPGAAPADSAAAFAHVYRTSLEVGGDFFTVLQPSPTTATLFVCDVMGHGMRSALLTAMIRGILDELGAEAAAPGQVLTEINRSFGVVLQSVGEFIFVTALCIAVDLRTGTLRWAGAGHPPALHLPREAAPRWLTAGTAEPAPVLGLERKRTYDEHTDALEPGDRLLLYTDGLTEAENETGAVFGKDRLLAAAVEARGRPLADQLQATIGRLEGFSHLTEFEDDVCLVGMELSRLLPEGDTS